jgi:predicted nucleic acid-binding protein
LTRTLTIDSFAWVELIRGTGLAMEIRNRIEQADTCLTPAIVLAEVAHRCFQDGLEEDRVRRELREIRLASHVVPIDAELAIRGSQAKIELRERAKGQRLPPPGLADGLVLATARRFQSQVLTGDPHFRGLPETRGSGDDSQDTPRARVTTETAGRLDDGPRRASSGFRRLSRRRDSSCDRGHTEEGRCGRRGKWVRLGLLRRSAGTGG